MQLIHYKNIDITKWNECVFSDNYFYATYENLSAHGEWYALIKDNGQFYEWVFPVPFKKKWFIKLFYTPLGIQQLGFIGSKPTQYEIEQVAVQIEATFHFGALQVNILNGNFTNVLPITERRNLILNLNQNFEEIISNFNSNRKRQWKKLENNSDFIIKKTENQDLKQFFLELEKQLGHKIQGFNSIHYQNVLNGIEKSALSYEIWEYTYLNKSVASALFIQFNKRWIYLGGFVLEKYTSKGLSTGLFYQFIKKYSETDSILDFEGGEIKSIADFYLSLGAEGEIYHVIYHRKWILSLIQSIKKFLK